MEEIRSALQRPIITGGTAGKTVQLNKQQSAAQSFGEMLQQKISGTSTELTFSKHAKTRTEQRNIDLTANDIERLNAAVGKAENKGLTDTLVVMNNTAFIVNVPNRVVITVMDGSESEENVFTNIDGAVII